MRASAVPAKIGMGGKAAMPSFRALSQAVLQLMSDRPAGWKVLLSCALPPDSVGTDARLVVVYALPCWELLVQDVIGSYEKTVGTHTPWQGDAPLEPGGVMVLDGLRVQVKLYEVVEVCRSLPKGDPALVGLLAASSKRTSKPFSDAGREAQACVGRGVRACVPTRAGAV